MPIWITIAGVIISILSDVFESKNVIALRYSYQGVYSTAYYSKRNGTLVNTGAFWINDLDQIVMPTIIAASSDGTGFIGQIEAAVFKKIVQENAGSVSDRVRAIADQLEYTDNPVIVKYTLKDF